MKKMLVINATSNKETSHTYFIYRHFLDVLNLDGFEIKELDLFDMNLPMFDMDNYNARLGILEKTDEDVMFDTLVDEFTDADAYIFITPTWNLSVPNVLKNYFDIVLVAGNSFGYEGHIRTGLLNEKKALIINTGGWQTANAAEYITRICNFINLNYHVARLDGTGYKFKTYEDMLQYVNVPPNFFQHTNNFY